VDDVIPYDELAASYSPRTGSRFNRVDQAQDQYLERPYLHYTIGTRVTPRVIDELRSHKIGSVLTHKEVPPFEPEVVKARNILETDPDWMTRLAGENLKRSMVEAARSGAQSVPGGLSYFPAVASVTALGRRRFERNNVQNQQQQPTGQER
jgi:hypothetical protein